MKKLSFKKLITDFKRFVQAKSGVRDILKCLFYDGKNLYSTDSSVAVKLNADYVDDLPGQDPFLYNVYEKKIVEQETKYPNLDRLFTDSFRTEVRVTPDKLDELRQATDLMHGIAKDNKNHAMQLDVVDGVMKLSVDKLEEDAFWGGVSGAQVIRDLDATGEDVSLSLSADYLKKALMTADKLRKLNNDDTCINIRFNGNLRPITIDSGDIFEMLVLPVKAHEDMKTDGRYIEPAEVPRMVDEAAPTISKRTKDAYKKRNQRQEKKPAAPAAARKKKEATPAAAKPAKPAAPAKPRQETEDQVKEALTYLDERITSHEITLNGRIITARKRENVRGQKNFEVRVLVDGGVSVNVSRKTTTRYENLEEALQGIAEIAAIEAAAAKPEPAAEPAAAPTERVEADTPAPKQEDKHQDLHAGDLAKVASVSSFTDEGLKPLVPLDSIVEIVGYTGRDKQRVIVKHEGSMHIVPVYELQPYQKPAIPGRPECIERYCESCGVETIFVAIDDAYQEYVCALYEDHEDYTDHQEAQEIQETQEVPAPAEPETVEPAAAETHGGIEPAGQGEQPTARVQVTRERTGTRLFPVLSPGKHVRTLQKTRGTPVYQAPHSPGPTLTIRINGKNAHHHQVTRKIEKRTRGPTYNQVRDVKPRKTKRKETIP